MHQIWAEAQLMMRWEMALMYLLQKIEFKSLQRLGIKTQWLITDIQEFIKTAVAYLDTPLAYIINNN